MHKALVAIVGVALVVTAGIVGWREWRHVDPLRESGGDCVATVGSDRVTLDADQARWAGLIAVVAVERGMPARAASIGLAAAYQESKLHNLRGGDRDSVGLFQQRPSQGWGSPAQLLDPVYATNAFYDALARVDGYESMPITEAAQAVQRSGYPSAYAVHEREARALASALTGNSAHAFSCRVGLPARAASARGVRLALDAVYPHQPVRSSRAGLAVAAGDRVRGWAVAQYLVSQAGRLRLVAVAYDGQTWRAGHHDGWQADDASGPHRVRVTLAG